MSTVNTTRRIRLDSLGFPASQVGNDTDGYAVTADKPQAELQAAVDAAPTNNSDANNLTLRQQAVAALVTNRTDLNQSQTIATQAATIANTGTTTFTLAQASNHIRSLAQAVKILADHDVATKRQVNALIRLVLGQLDGTD